jgi:photosystem II stability/assembly factor-like uncharacterized protein
VGDNGTILKTVNGGTSWSAEPSGTNSKLVSVNFPDAITGYAVGDSGIILKTDNGGTTWTVESSGTTLDLKSVYFTNTQTGYIVGNGGILLKTSDGGATWADLSSGSSYNLNSVYFPDANTGYTVGDYGTILKTLNGGGVLGINDKQQTNSLKIYPNPATEKITIEPQDPGSGMNGTVTVYGMTGRELIRQHVQGSRIEINVRSLPAGLYFVNLVNEEKKVSIPVEAGKFIKN